MLDQEKNDGYVKLVAQIFERIGLPTVIVAIGFFAAYNVAIWLATNIIQPTFSDNKALVASQIDSNRALMISLGEISESMKIQTHINEQNSESLEAMASDLGDIKKTIEAKE